MSKVLHAVTDFTSYLQYTFPGTHTEVYAQWNQSLSASANAGTFEGFLFLINGAGVVDNIRVVAGALKTKWAVGPFADLVPYVFYTFGLHSKLTAGTLTTHVTVNGTDVGTITNIGATGLAAMTGFKLGGIDTGTPPDEVWVDNVTVGTTSFGSSDLFSETFE